MDHDQNQITEMLARLPFPPTGLIGLAAFHDSDKLAKPRVRWLQAEDAKAGGTSARKAIGEMARWNSQGYGVFFTTSSLKSEERKKDNTAAHSCLFLDLDAKAVEGFYDDPQGTVSSLAERAVTWSQAQACAITVAVMSGGGLHLYWQLDSAVSAAKWQPLADALERRAKAEFGKVCDTGITTDPVRVLRMPGFYNCKPNRGEFPRADMTPDLHLPHPVSAIAEWLEPELQELEREAALRRIAGPTRQDASAALGKLGLDKVKLAKVTGSAFAEVAKEQRPHLQRLIDPLDGAPRCNLMVHAATTGGKGLTGFVTTSVLQVVKKCGGSFDEALPLVDQHAEFTEAWCEREYARSDLEPMGCERLSALAPDQCGTCAHHAGPACGMKFAVGSPMQIAEWARSVTPLDTALAKVAVLRPETVEPEQVAELLAEVKALGLPHAERQKVASAVGALTSAAAKLVETDSPKAFDLTRLGYNQVQAALAPAAATPEETEAAKAAKDAEKKAQQAAQRVIADDEFADLRDKYVCNETTMKYRIPTNDFWVSARAVEARLATAISKATVKLFGERSRVDLMESQGLFRVVMDEVYLPGEGRFIPRSTRDGGLGEVYNTYHPASHVAKHPNDWTTEDRAAWDRFVQHRHKAYPQHGDHLLKTQAWLVQRPGIKLQTMTILVGPPGSGKSTIARSMARVLGAHNVNMAAQPKHTIATHNKEVAVGFQLVHFDEMQSNREDGEKIVTFFKGALTGSTISLRQMGVSETQVVSNVSYFGCSNHTDVLPFGQERKFGVLVSPFMGYTKEQLADEGFTQDYFTKLNDDIGYEDAPGKVCHIEAITGGLKYLVDLTGFEAGTLPDVMDGLETVREASRTQLESDILDLMTSEGWDGKVHVGGISTEVVWFDQLRDAYEQRYPSQRWSSQKARAALEILGLQRRKGSGPGDQIRAGKGLTTVYARIGSTLDKAALLALRDITTRSSE